MIRSYIIPTRYPNGLPDLTPGQVYRQEDATRGLEAARLLVTACRHWLEAYQHTPEVPPNLTGIDDVHDESIPGESESDKG